MPDSYEDEDWEDWEDWDDAGEYSRPGIPSDYDQLNEMFRAMNESGNDHERVHCTRSQCYLPLV